MSTVLMQSKSGRNRLHLLPSKELIATSDVDHADWNFRPVVGNVIRLRYQMMQKLLAGRRFDRMLEVGYGSGVFMPHLARHVNHLYGIDPHQRVPEVTQVLKRFDVEAKLDSGSATALPYADEFFDGIVAVSCLEFIDDLPKACREFHRVLRPGGSLMVVTPGESRVLDLGLKLLTGASPRDDFGDRRRGIIPTLLSHFDLVRRIDQPRFLHRVVRLYTAFELGRKN